MTPDETAVSGPDAFVVHADLSGRVFAAAFLVLCGLGVAALALTGLLLGVTTAAGAATTGGAVAGLAVIAAALALAAGALWLGRTEGPAVLAESIRRRRGVDLTVGADGVAFGTGRPVPWAEVRELLVTETGAGGGGEAGEPGFVPCLAVVPVIGAALPDVSLAGFRGDRDVVAALEPVVHRYAPQVPVRDRRWRSAP
jgi:hypothetical protein